MKILFVINEAQPLYKLGGLGDVGQGLSKALLGLGHDLRLCLPYHPEIKLTDSHTFFHRQVTYAGQVYPYSLVLTYLPQSAVPVYLVQEPQIISKSTNAMDTHVDKAALFCLCVADWLSQFEPWQPQLLHLHDWHASLLPVILKHQYSNRLPSILTIHNHRYTGQTTDSILKKLALPETACQILRWDQSDHEINLLLEGILHVDQVTTVSPTYQKELVAESSVMGEILAQKQHRFTGITNGLDLDTWNPSADPLLKQTYAAESAGTIKAELRSQIYQSFNLPANDTPLIIFIGRLDPGQKGLHLILQAAGSDRFPPTQTNFMLLGTGDPQLEQSLHQNFDPHSRCRIFTRYDETLAHRLYAAADIILIPSDYEPCGLIQLIAMRYGCLPLAHQTGGLNDTISHLKTGILYRPNRLKPFLTGLSQALTLFRTSHRQLSYYRTLMDQDFSWDKAAQAYNRLYHSTISGDTLG